MEPFPDLDLLEGLRYLDLLLAAGMTMNWEMWGSGGLECGEGAGRRSGGKERPTNIYL